MRSVFVCFIPQPPDEPQRDGDCFRLYTHDAFNKFSNYDAPEIQRCNLASAVLHLIAMGLNPFTFEYIDNPGRDNSESIARTVW